MSRSPHISADPSFSSLKGLLLGGATPPDPSSPLPEGGPHAAVSLILRKGPELELLLIKRAESDGDPWSGHMALPGGRWEESDPNLLATAIRETSEETGVRLNGREGVLGELPPMVPAVHRLPPISIFPFVFGVEEGTEAMVASPEVDEVLWTPISHLSSPGTSGTVDIPLGGEIRSFPCYRVEGRVIWGITYRILRDFLQKLKDHAPQLLGNA